ncbi:MAG TPA: hypothetical protein VG167_00905 [Verrucomicrobiae bacterium]|nr:hypothetical protein [Verrucomicrobiae bacterium]
MSDANKVGQTPLTKKPPGIRKVPGVGQPLVKQVDPASVKRKVPAPPPVPPTGAAKN